jgi:hypothetical protein
MNLYMIDVKLAGSVCAKADSAEEALEKIKRFLAETNLEFVADGEIISGRAFNDPALPEVSLSPAFSSHGIWDDFNMGAELVEEGLPAHDPDKALL